MTKLICQVGHADDGLVSLHVEPGDTVGSVTVNAGGRGARVLAGGPALQQIAAACAAVGQGTTTGEAVVSVFTGHGGDSTASVSTGLFSLLPGGTAIVTVTPERGGGSVAAEITLHELTEFGLACSAASYNL